MPLVWCCISGHDRSPALTDDDQALVGHTATACCKVATGTPCETLISRTEGSGSPGTSIPEVIESLSVSATCRQAGRRVSGRTCEDRHIPVLSEPLPRASRIAAAPQLGVKQIEQGAAYLPDLQMPKSGLDHPPDIDLVRLPGGQVPLGNFGIPVHQLGHGDVRFGLAARVGLLEQLAELDLRGPLGLAGLPKPDFLTRKRVSPGVNLDAPGPARQLLYVSGWGLCHDMTVHLGADIGPRTGPRGVCLDPVFPGGAPGGRTLNQWVKSPLLCH